MSRILSVAVLAANLAISSVAAHAQAERSAHFNLAAGVTLPTGSFSDGNDAGYNLIAGLGIRQPGSALGFRVEGIYNEFNEKGTNDKSHAGGVTGNVTYDLAERTRSKTSSLYLIGGVGYYSTREPFFTTESQTNVGWNVGGGFEFPLSGFSGYLEARYHTVSNTDVRFVPISFGLIF